ncbi:PadR family transcriptional regulator [Janibacter sp. Soil728]|uniref:PadR family transcriptional regulator n=1 Tax=Janibacter sp. Soil728 TaxID=1736393 RepID=UPI0006F48FD2|nr:PadR family transcriptional regulator [Janibacter sp. Soil728]KRE38224.1 PadR family transcriptional regulator [Janibacter sp. Soil728]
MALQDAILTALAHDESSGYDLAKAFDVSVANYWTASPQQLYRELDKLEDAGLVTARTVAQSKRPDKRVFRLTAAGRAALRAHTLRSPKPMAVRDELLVQVAALESGEPEAIREHVVERLEAFEAKLAVYRLVQERTLAGRPEEEYLVAEPRVGQYLTLLRGISFEEENIRWAQQVLTVLDARQAPPG